AECFNRVVTDEVRQENAECGSDMNSYRLSRARFWKEMFLQLTLLQLMRALR
uniref:Uncharacterized protein n=1 Tax=Aegilops tauschii subsp. strangulata TaxID=200361 RepID=A0A453FMD8_AEGTS